MTKKLLKIILVLMMTVLLFACSKNSEQNNNEEKKEPVPDYPISEKYGEQIYTYRMFEIPVATGYPQLSMKDLSDITPENINERINTYADLLNYLTYSDNQNYNIDSEKVDVYKASNIISGGEYEEVGIIDLTFKNSVEQYLYIKADGKYYPLDLARQGASVTTKWLANFEDGQYVFDDLDKVIKAVSDNFPYKQTLGEVISTDHHSTFFSFITGPNGEKIEMTEINGEKAYRFNDYSYLSEYGTPELSDQEIEALINKMNEGDYETVRNSVNTIPDFINLFIRSGFKGNDGIYSTSQYDGPNVGHIYYADEGYTLEGGKIEYTISGVESMILKEGQCDSTATLFHYFFHDKFDEVGYVLIQCFNSNKRFGYDCHAINYFKTNDKYYLFSPSYALTGDTAWGFHTELWSSSDSIDELAKRLYDSTYPNGTVAVALLFEYDGVLAEGRTWNHRTDPLQNYITLPEGSDVKVCYGTNYVFLNPMHSTSQDHIIGVQTK